MSGDRKQKFLRRFAPGFYDSGFRVKPGMTIHFFDCGLFFVSPGVFPQSAAKARANDYSPTPTLAGLIFAGRPLPHARRNAPNLSSFLCVSVVKGSVFGFAFLRALRVSVLSVLKEVRSAALSSVFCPQSSVAL
jgi:hypothetical protein